MTRLRRRKPVRRAIIAAASLIILAAANYGIYEKEGILTNGRVVLLEVAPVDPRSLMQGDYMALRFRVANDAFGPAMMENVRDGRIVLALDDRGVGKFVRIDDGSAIGASEVVMRYRVRQGQPKFGTNAFFFREGQGQVYASARYGEFRVSSSGDSILTNLRGEKLEVLGR